MAKITFGKLCRETKIRQILSKNIEIRVYEADIFRQNHGLRPKKTYVGLPLSTPNFPTGSDHQGFIFIYWA